jgi:fibronectin type 3 domain-containing protein
MGQTIEAVNGKITLSWNGSDVDNDIVTYDVYLSDSASPALLQSNVSENALKDVSVSAGKTYYWKIITRDSKGNTSDSGIYLFMTK